jgi:hypothetical protein
MSAETAMQSERIIPGEARARELAAGMTKVATEAFEDWLAGPTQLGRARLAYLEAKFAAVDWLEDSTSDEYRQWDHGTAPLVLRSGWTIEMATDSESQDPPIFVALPPDA